VIKLSEKEFFMSRAIKLAKLGWGKTNPNPLVGAVVVKDGKIIAEGYHKQLGGPHAEVELLTTQRRTLPAALCMSIWSHVPITAGRRPVLKNY